MESPEQLLRRVISESKASRQYEDQIAMRMVNAIRSRDMELMREILHERLADDGDGDSDSETGSEPRGPAAGQTVESGAT